MKLKILFLTQGGETLPSVRFRVLPFIHIWKNQGIDVSYFKLPKTLIKKIPFYFKLPKADVIILQKKLVSKSELFLIKTKAKKICFDFDDAVWTSHPSVKLTLKIKKKNFKNRTRLLNIVKNVDLVICGNQYLCSNIWDFTPNTLILPTSIDIDKYCPTPQEKTEKKNFVVGWIGTNSNIFFMKNIFESIKKIEGIQIKVVSNKNLNVNLPRGVIFEIWDANREVEQIRSFNIGLMPLLDDEYTRGKCGFKIIQYMSCGVVPIASDVGFNRDIISHGQDGFLVKKEHEWIKYIQMLREDVSLQKKMSTNARKKIEKNFNIKNSANILLRKIQSLL